MNNTTELGYFVTPVPTSPILFFFSKPLPIMQMILRFHKTFDFMLKTTKYWYQLLAFCFPTPYFI